MFLVCSLGLMAQADNIVEFHQVSLQTRQKAMIVLGSWAAGNMLLGASLMPSRQGSDKHFHQMNIMWNAVNLGIAALGYWQASKATPEGWDSYEVVKDHFNMQKVLLFNAGLDVGYMATGLYLTERAKRGGEQSDKLRGWGQSIMIQGGFLFVFDIVTTIVMSRQNPDIQSLMGALRFNGQEIGLSFVF